MVTNDKEYQRQYQAEYRTTHPQKQYKKSKEQVKKVKNDPMLEISLKRLRPPREVETEPVESLTGINVNIGSSVSSKASAVDPVHWLANNHSFNMLINEMLSKFAPGFKEFGIKTRGTKQVIRSSFDNTRAELLKELKEVLRKRNES